MPTRSTSPAARDTSRSDPRKRRTAPQERKPSRSSTGTPPLDDREPWEARRAADLRRSKVIRAQRLLALQAAGPAALAEDRKRCKGSGPYDVKALLHWIGWYGWVQDPQSTDHALRDGTPLDLWPRQADVCRWLLERVRLRQIALAPKSRKVGITWLMLHIILWLWMFHSIGAIVGSRTQAAVDRLDDPDALFPKLEWLLALQPPHIRPRRVERKYNVIHDLNSRAAIRGQSTARDFARSSRELITLLDEAGAIDAARLRSILSSTESAAGSLWLPYQPPEGAGHPLEELYRELDPAMVQVLDWTTDPYRPDDFLETRIRPVGRLTRQQALREYGGAHGTSPEGAVWDIPQSAWYDEADPVFAVVAESIRKRALIVPGWDFGSGASQLTCPVLIYDRTEGRLRVWLDDCRIWSRVSYRVAAVDHAAMMRQYGAGYYVDYGDPAGRAPESGQTSWESNLRDSGVPLICLEDSFNGSTPQRLLIQEVQDMLLDGTLRIHKRTEDTAGASMRSWRWNTPAGQRPEEVNRAITMPRLDWPSHVCKAVIYSLMGAKLELHRDRGQPSPQTRGQGSRQTVQDFLRKGRF